MVMVFKKFFLFKVLFTILFGVLVKHPKNGCIAKPKNVTTETSQSPVFQITRQQSNEHQQKSYDHQELSEVVPIQVLSFHFKVGTQFTVQMNRHGHEFGDRFGHRVTNIDKFQNSRCAYDIHQTLKSLKIRNSIRFHKTLEIDR